VRDAIRDGLLHGRGHSFGIDGQPIPPEWMRVAMWDDAQDDAIFFREEKGADLVPSMRVPPHVTRIEVLEADVQRLWPLAVNRKRTRETDVEKPKRQRGPKPEQRERVEKAMWAGLSRGDFTRETLEREKEVVLEKRYEASRDTCRKARNTVLSELKSN
jgi:hypothetical protein